MTHVRHIVPGQRMGHYHQGQTTTTEKRSLLHLPLIGNLHAPATCTHAATGAAKPSNMLLMDHPKARSRTPTCLTPLAHSSLAEEEPSSPMHDEFLRDRIQGKGSPRSPFAL
jgi:hypothetical protein